MVNMLSGVLDIKEGHREGVPVRHCCLGALLPLATPTSNDISSQTPTCRPVILLLNIANTCNNHQPNNTLYRLQPLEIHHEENSGEQNNPGCLHIPSAPQSLAAPSSKNDLKFTVEEHSRPTMSSTNVPPPVQAQSEKEMDSIFPEASHPCQPKKMEFLPPPYFGDNDIWSNDNSFNDFSDNLDFTSMFDPHSLESQNMATGHVDRRLHLISMAATNSSSFGFGEFKAPALPEMNFASMPAATSSMPVDTQVTTSLPHTNARNRFPCNHPNCITDFARLGDLRRHQRVHGTQGAPRYPCTVNNCVRKGAMAYYRRDKLLEHMRKKHGMVV